MNKRKRESGKELNNKYIKNKKILIIFFVNLCLRKFFFVLKKHSHHFSSTIINYSIQTNQFCLKKKRYNDINNPVTI